jgi:hypothetical protein
LQRADNKYLGLVSITTTQLCHFSKKKGNIEKKIWTRHGRASQDFYVAEAGGLSVQSQPGLHSETLSQKKKKEKKRVMAVFQKNY